MNSVKNIEIAYYCDEIENQEIFSFLSEYYLIYPDKLPRAELF